jgi:V/A-type H+-transporting ATPase subunit D
MRGYDLAASSASIDAVAEAFEEQLQLVVKMAAEELRLRRLADELRKVSRRVNALDAVVLPRLERELAVTMTKLEERDREDRYRLQRMKARSRRRREAS